MGMIVSIVRKYEMLDLLMGSAAKMNWLVGLKKEKKSDKTPS